MRFLLFFIAESPKARSEFLNKKSLIEQIIRTRFKVRDISVLLLAVSPYEKSLLEFVQKMILDSNEEVDHILVLIESEHLVTLETIRNAVFIGAIDDFGYRTNVWTGLADYLTKLLKNYKLFFDLISAQINYEVLALPIRNFRADEFGELLTTFKNKTLDREFFNSLSKSLGAMRRRRQPKRRSSYPDKYYMDIRQLYFQYGKELHSKYATGEGHLLSCQINGLYRFGYRLEQGRHYNVSTGDGNKRVMMNLTLINCHDEKVKVKNRDHVNMFSPYR